MVHVESESQLRDAEEVIDEDWWREASVVADECERSLSPTRNPRDDLRTPTATPSPPSPQPVALSLEVQQQASSAPLVHDHFGGAIISIGPHTDATLDRFHLPDTLVPRLRNLSTTVRSSKWEATLRTTSWALSFEQASNLSKAMVADIKNETFHTVQVCNQPLE